MLADSTTAPERVAVPEMQPPRVIVHQVSPRVLREGQEVLVELSVEPRGASFVAQPSRVNVWVNDCLVKEWTSVAIPFREKILIPYTMFRYGANPVVVQAYNRKGAREDHGRETVVRSQPAKERRLLGLMVGVSDYVNAIPLSYAATDAASVYAAYRKLPRGKLYTHIVEPELLTNAQATGEKILLALERLQKQLKDRPDDTLVLYLSGHGSGKQEKAVFLPQTWFFLGTDYTSKRETTRISSEKLYRLLASLPCRKVILLDTCHSGANADVIRDLTPEGIGPSILTRNGPARSQRMILSPCIARKVRGTKWRLPGRSTWASTR
jgi:hypothetical protein